MILGLWLSIGPSGCLHCLLLFENLSRVSFLLSAIEKDPLCEVDQTVDRHTIFLIYFFFKFFFFSNLERIFFDHHLFLKIRQIHIILTQFSNWALLPNVCMSHIKLRLVIVCRRMDPNTKYVCSMIHLK